MQNKWVDNYLEAAMACLKWLHYKNAKFNDIHLNKAHQTEFVEMLGFKMIKRYGNTHIPAQNPEFNRIIRLINSPHGHTILKILEIKHAKRSE